MGVEKKLSDYADAKNRKKYSRLRGKTKEATIHALQAKKREEEDALIKNINQTHPSSKEVLENPSKIDEIEDNFDSYIGRKAA